MLPCGTPQLRVRADDSLPLTLHLWVRPLKYDENQSACPACCAFLSRRAQLPWHTQKMCAVTIVDTVHGNYSNKRRPQISTAFGGFNELLGAYSRKYSTKRYYYGFKRPIFGEKT